MSGSKSHVEDNRVVLSGSVLINRPAGDVFAYVADLENYPSWFPGIGKMKARDRSPPGTVGKAYDEIAYRGGGKAADINVEVVEFVPARRLAMHADLQPVLPRFDYEVVGQPDGTCMFYWSCRRRGNGVEAEAGHQLMRGVLLARLERALESLKLRLEQVPGTLMRAAVARRFGPAEEVMVLDPHFPRPRPGKGEVLVRQRASSVNRIDLARRNGYGAAVFDARGVGGFPMILGCDVCGLVEAVGEGVSGFRPGDRIFGAKPSSLSGTFAEYVAVEASLLALAPAGVPDEQLAATPYVFLTAWTALHRDAGLSPETAAGKRVFVQGGAGAVGSMAVQLAKAWGAYVAATCDTSEVEIARALGADEVFDYRRQDFSAHLRDFDIALCTADPAEQSKMLSILKRGGDAVYATVVHPTLKLADELGLVAGGLKAKEIKAAENEAERSSKRRIEWTLFKPDPAGLATLASLLAAGAIKAVVAKTIPLDSLAHAQRQIEQGARGKYVVEIETSS